MLRSPKLVSFALVLACAPEPDPPAPDPEVPPDVAYCDVVRDWDPAWAAFEDEVVALLNERRAEGAQCKLDLVFPPAEALTMDPALRCAARFHALDMAAEDYFSNVDADGLSFAERAASAGYEGTALEQNIGAGHSTPEQLVTAVMGNVELCVHVMDPEADEVGVGFLEYEDAYYPSYWVQVFGRSE